MKAMVITLVTAVVSEMYIPCKKIPHILSKKDYINNKNQQRICDNIKQPTPVLDVIFLGSEIKQVEQFDVKT